MPTAHVIPSPSIEQILLLVGLYMLVLLPYYFGIRAESFILKSHFVKRVRHCVELLDSQNVSADDVAHFGNMIKQLESATSVKKGIVAMGSVTATVKELREHHGLGRRIVAAEHLMTMWRHFAGTVSDTWFDALMVGGVALLGYLIANRAVSPDPWVIVYSALSNSLRDLWLPTAEIALMLMAARTYSMLKKQTNIYEKELKLHEPV